MPGFERTFGISIVLRTQLGDTEAFTARREIRPPVDEGRPVGIRLEADIRVYLLPKASVVVGSTAYKPKEGDRIADDGEVFTILPPDDITPAVEEEAGLHDWRVYTKKQNA